MRDSDSSVVHRLAHLTHATPSDHYWLISSYVAHYPVLKTLVNPETGHREDYHHGQLAWPARDTIGWRLFPRNSTYHVQEFDRTAMNLIVLKCLIRGQKDDYEFLTAPQPWEQKLTWESFEKLGDFLRYFCDDPTAGGLLEYLICIHDFGKTPAARELMEKTGQTAPTHGARLSYLCEQQLVPGLTDFSADEIQHLCRTIQYGFDAGQLILGEAPTGITQNFTSRLSDYEKRLNLAVCICDLAGSSGHLCQTGSPTLHEENAQRLLFLIDHRNDPELGRAFTSEQIQKLELAGTRQKIATAAVRISLMCKREPWAPELAHYLTEAYPVYEILVRELFFSGTEANRRPAIVPYFGPALIRCTLDHFGVRYGDFEDAVPAFDLVLPYLQQRFIKERLKIVRHGTSQHFHRLDLRDALSLAAENPTQFQL